MMHGARLEFSKLRLQEPAPPVIPAPQATQPLPAPGAASLQNTMNSVKLPLLQVRLASLASLPAPTAAAAAATSLQDTTDIECPVLVAALPGEAGFAGQTHRTWAPFKPTGMLPDQTIVTGIVFATEVLQPPTPTPHPTALQQVGLHLHVLCAALTDRRRTTLGRQGHLCCCSRALVNKPGWSSRI